MAQVLLTLVIAFIVVLLVTCLLALLSTVFGDDIDF